MSDTHSSTLRVTYPSFALIASPSAQRQPPTTPKKPKPKLGRQKRRRPRNPLAPIDNVIDDVLEGADEEEVGDARDDARDAARNDMVARNMAPGAPMDRAPAPAGELGDGVRDASGAMAVDLPAQASQRTL